MKIFRQFRQYLLTENPPGKFRRYFLYAIGEIALVMIGILLALQVNTWNENRKDQEYLDFSLKEIYLDLKSDLQLIYGAIEPRLQTKEKGVKKVYSLILQKEPPADSTFLKAYRNMNHWFLLSTADASYQSLKEKGLDIVKNEPLRYGLFYLYESMIPRTKQFIHGRDEELQQQISDLEQELFRLEIVQHEEGDPHHIKVPVSPDYIHLQALHKILDLNDNDSEHKRYRLDRLKKDYFELMSIMEEEMTRRAISFISFDSTSVKRDF